MAGEELQEEAGVEEGQMCQRLAEALGEVEEEGQIQMMAEAQGGEVVRSQKMGWEAAQAEELHQKLVEVPEEVAAVHRQRMEGVQGEEEGEGPMC